MAQVQDVIPIFGIGDPGGGQLLFHRVPDGEEDVVPAEVVIGSIGSLEEQEKGVHIVQHTLQGQAPPRFMGGGEPFHLLLREGMVLLMEVRGVGGDVDGLLLCDDRFPGGVHPVQELLKVHRLRRGGGFRRRGGGGNGNGLRGDGAGGR